MLQLPNAFMCVLTYYPSPLVKTQNNNKYISNLLLKFPQQVGTLYYVINLKACKTRIFRKKY